MKQRTCAEGELYSNRPNGCFLFCTVSATGTRQIVHDIEKQRTALEGSFKAVHWVGQDFGNRMGYAEALHRAVFLF